jgi:hypothetical protein
MPRLKLPVKKKMLGTPSTAVSGWIQLAEDAEQDAEKALTRSKQLKEAAQIFRRNAESGEPWPMGCNAVTPSNTA